MNNLEITIKAEGNVLNVAVWGKISSDNSEEFAQKVLSSILDCTDVSFDFRGVDYISSAGLRVLLVVKKAVSGDVRIWGVKDHVYQIFDVTGFTDLLDVNHDPYTNPVTF